MKKLLRNIALLLLPIVAYYALFLVFEPNNYFGLRRETPSGVPVGVLREYERNPQPSVIIGDSRVAHFDMDVVQATAGRPFGSIAYGGASFKESLDLLYCWTDRYLDIDEVVFSVSFYTLNKNYTRDRLDGLLDALHNPFVYLTNLSFHIETLKTIQEFLNGETLYGGESETSNPAEYVYTEYTAPNGQTVMVREEMLAYLEDISTYTSGWQANTEQIERLLEAIEDFTARGIQFVVVLPPTHYSVYDFLIEPEGITEPVAEFVEQCRQAGALVLDYEVTDRPNLQDDQFFDGFHLDSQRGLDEWTRMLFLDINEGEALLWPHKAG